MGLRHDLIKKGISNHIAKKIEDNFSEIGNTDQLVDFACTEEGKMKLEQLLASKSLSALNRIIEKRKGLGVRPLGKGKSLSSAKTITELGEQDNPVAGTWRLPDDPEDGNEEGENQDEELPESLGKHTQDLMEQRRDLLYSNLAIYGVSGNILEALVRKFPWLQDFFSLFMMACTRIGAKMICSVLTPDDGVSELNELFLKEYGCKPLPEPEKKKAGRPPKVLQLAAEGAPC